MSLVEILEPWAQWLEATSVAQAIGSSDYLFPLLEVVHVVGLALVIGTIGIVDLRLLGFASMRRPVRDVADHMLPLAWTGFSIAAVSGALMFTSSAVNYLGNRAFQIKLVIMLLAGLNMLAFHRRIWKSVAAWDRADKPPGAARAAGAVSLSCWIVIVFLGRWIGFVG